MSGKQIHPGNPFIPPIQTSCPILKLPVELLAHVFELALACRNEDENEDHCLNEFHDFGRRARGRAPVKARGSTGDPWFPFIISHVCRRWRNAAIAMPFLWAVITITPTLRSPCHRVFTQLERSKKVPIDLQIDLLDVSDDALFALLAAHVHHWRSVDMCVASYALMDEFLATVSKQSMLIATQITTLKLDCMHHHAEEFLQCFPLFVCSAPSLKSITLRGVYVDWAQPWICSASNLATLELAGYLATYPGPSWTELVTILRGAPHLKVLILSTWSLFDYIDYEGDWSSPDMADECTPIQLLELRQLELSSMPFAFIIKLLRNLHTPTLKNFAMRPTDLETSDELYQRLVAQLAETTSLGGIEHLYVLEFSWADIESLYAKLNDLRSLTVSDSLTFLYHLLASTGHPGKVWMPKLEVITMSPVPHHWGYQQIRALARQRKDAGVPLKCLDLRWQRDPIADDGNLAWLRANLEVLSSKWQRY